MRWMFVLMLGVGLIENLLALPLSSLQLPPGFKIELYAEVPKARQLALGPNNTVFVGTLGDTVYAIIPDSKDNKSRRVVPIAKDLNKPNGVAFANGALYVAEIDKILRFDNIANYLENPTKPTVIYDTLPKDEHHGYRFIRFSPEGQLYVGVGAPCNVCTNEDPRMGTIMRMDSDGKNEEIYAKGVRNSMGFDWDPKTKKLWFTDNGRDLLGDDIPPDELNYAPEKGKDFGFPYFMGNNIPDPVFGQLRPASEFTPPALDLPAHVAALGMTFYNGSQFPSDYQNRIFIAEHGSWDRSKKIGYQVISVKINGDQASDPKPFVSGWLKDEKAWGRPVATLVIPDGSLLISDDTAGAVYRVTYQPQTAKKVTKKKLARN